MDIFSQLALGKSAVALATAGSLAFSPGWFFHKKERAERPERTPRVALQVVLSDNGGALVRGAEVTAISDSTITATTEWGDASLTWRIETDNETEYYDERGRDEDRDEIDVGDTVSFRGTIDDDDSAFTVDASVVKDWSSE
jgi:hypothetical protein